MSRNTLVPEQAPKVTDLLIRQKCEAMIEYGYVALRQFPAFERHVLAAETVSYTHLTLPTKRIV